MSRLPDHSFSMSLPPPKLLEGLNPRQAEAVRQTEGPVLVLAGAGSGKTRVITRRIAYILAKKLAAPDQILAVTFTNKAAAEMRQRVSELIGKKAAAEIVISTFHSFCLMVLRKDIEHLGFRRNFSIASDSDSRTLIRRVVEDLSTTESFSMANFQAVISLCKNTSDDPDPEKPMLIKSETEEKYAEHLPLVYEQYQSALRAANSLDFDDLLTHTLKLWREHPRILDRYQKQFRYVMVDEYQDTNKVQYELLRTLVAEHRNFCVVGDDDQSIYAWRGADTRNILDFEKHFPNAKVVTLDQNYRSTETILEAANSVIRNNGSRREKKLWSELGKGRNIDWLVVADEEEEANRAVEWLKHIQERTGAKFSDFALLYRSNLQSRPLEIAFRQAGIPYVVFGGQEFFDRAEVKDIIAYLKLIANSRDEAALLRIVNMPRRGIGDVTLHRAHELCLKEKLPICQALAEVAKRGDVHAQADGGIREFLGMINHFRKRFRERESSLKTLVEELITAIDYHSELQRISKSPQQALARWQNLELVVKAVGDYEEQHKDGTLAAFLDASHLNTDQDRFTRQERRQTGVTLMTIHSAKGLEFPFVFIMGMEEGLLPHEKCIVDGIEEERRLCYVALTRGRRHVTLFEALSRAKHGKERLSKTSRFLKEIPEHLLTTRVHAARDLVEAKLAPPKPAKKPRKPRAKKL